MSDWPPLPVPFVTALPTSPYDGQQVHFIADSANGVIWRLRYNAGSASTYKWEFVGGTEWYTKQDGEPQSSTSGTTYSNVTSVSLTAPLKGDYMVKFGLEMHFTNSPSYDMWCSIKSGSTAAADSNGCFGTTFGAIAQVADYSSMRKVKINVVNANDVLQMQARVDAGAAGVWLPWMTIRPIRVG